MTYCSRKSWISLGLGSSSNFRSEVSESSSSMISLQRSMHSSQMYTPGPAMSFLTCFWLFPQKEHLSRSPPSPMRAMSAYLTSHPACPCDAPVLTVLVQPALRGAQDCPQSARDGGKSARLA